MTILYHIVFASCTHLKLQVCTVDLMMASYVSLDIHQLSYVVFDITYSAHDLIHSTLTSPMQYFKIGSCNNKDVYFTTQTFRRQILLILHMSHLIILKYNVPSIVSGLLNMPYNLLDELYIITRARQLVN